MLKNDLCWTLAVGNWQRKLAYKLELRVIGIVRSHVVICLAVLPTLGRRKARGDRIPDSL